MDPDRTLRLRIQRAHSIGAIAEVPRSRHTVHLLGKEIALANLWWVYYPEHFPDDVILLNFVSRRSYSMRIYERGDAPPRKNTAADVGGIDPGDILKLAEWKEPVQEGIDVEKRPAWWRGQARSALRRVRAAQSE